MALHTTKAPQEKRHTNIAGIKCMNVGTNLNEQTGNVHKGSPIGSEGRR